MERAFFPNMSKGASRVSYEDPVRYQSSATGVIIASLLTTDCSVR